MSADSSDIVDHKLKLILGLIWTLILHYSISMPVWDDDENRGQLPEQTPKQRLLGWVQNKQPDKPIGNFTTDWNDGRAIGALVDGIAPGDTSIHFSLFCSRKFLCASSISSSSSSTVFLLLRLTCKCPSA